MTSVDACGTSKALEKPRSGAVLSQPYTYDALNRLDTATEVKDGSQVWKQDFEYDRFGNRTFNTANTTANVLGVNPAINPNNNRINAAGYTYDNAGNLINDPLHTYTYDAENKMVTNDGGANL